MAKLPKLTPIHVPDNGYGDQQIYFHEADDLFDDETYYDDVLIWPVGERHLVAEYLMQQDAEIAELRKSLEKCVEAYEDAVIYIEEPFLGKWHADRSEIIARAKKLIGGGTCGTE